MSKKSAQLSAFVLIWMSAALLSGCGGESKDAKLGQIFMDCQLSAHSALEASTATLTDEQRHFALGASVENCLKESGLKPASADGGECLESPQSPEDGKAFVKPIQKCWQNLKASKS